MNAIRLAVIASVLASFAFAAPVAAQTAMPGMPAMPAPLTVQMTAQNGSGQDGTAVLTQTPGGLQVVVSVKNGTAAAQPAHIHPGTCATLNPAPQYPLNSLTNGTSTTVLTGVTLAQLTAGTFAINVHKSTSDLGTYVSCGNIKAS